MIYSVHITHGTVPGGNTKTVMRQQPVTIGSADPPFCPPSPAVAKWRWIMPSTKRRVMASVSNPVFLRA
jgi:hypothetical protein